jgi:hypothetical protein
VLLGAFWVIYAPSHWLATFTASVTVDERAKEADVYIGNPTENEAEAIAFVHISAIGDYFLDFGNETFREASSREFLLFKRGVWTLAPMNSGHFISPLPSRKTNEFSFHTSNGHIVSVQF